MEGRRAVRRGKGGCGGNLRCLGSRIKQRTEKGKMEKYYEGELVTLLAYKTEASKDTSRCIFPGSKNTRPGKRALSPNPSHLCPND